MIWALVAGVLLIVVLLILVKPKGVGHDADPLAHYKEQLTEIDADLARGILDKESAASAKLEIERRILRTNTAKFQTVISSSGLSAVVPVATFVVVGSLAVYSFLGKPDAQSKPGVFVAMQNAQISEGGPTFKEALDKISLHLAENPDDVDGWNMMANTARSIGDYSLTVRAFENIARLKPTESRWRVEMLEAYLAMAQGKVTPAAKLVIQDILTLDPGHPAAHYYTGLARLQAGDSESAKAIWLALAERSPADAPWMPVINKNLAELGVRPPKLSQEQIDSVAEMSEEERAEFVRSMMARLAAKLEENPTDSQGWVMLARSQASLGDEKAAINTLKTALDAVKDADKPKIQALLDNLLNTNDF